MTRNPCLTEDQLLDLHYDELPEAEAAREHLAACSRCQTAWQALHRDLDGLSDPIPAGGERALAGALRTLGLRGESEPCVAPGRAGESEAPRSAAPSPAPAEEILTLAEVAAYLRVDEKQVRSLLPDLPHLDIGGVIRVRRPALEAFLARMERDSTRPAAGLEEPVLLRRDLI